MAIKPLVVLPKLDPVTFDANDASVNSSNRMMMELLDNQMNTEKERRRGLLSNVQGLDEWTDKTQFVGTTPYQQRVAAERQALIGEYSQGIQQKYRDPIEQAWAIRDLKSKVYGNPKFAGAEVEKMVVSTWLDSVLKNPDKVDPTVIAKTMELINSDTRQNPITPADLPFGHGLMSPDAYADQELGKLTKTTESIYYDEANKTRAKKTTGSFIVSEEQAVKDLTEKLSTHPSYAGLEPDALKSMAERRVRDFKAKHIDNPTFSQPDNYETRADYLARQNSAGQDNRLANFLKNMPGGNQLDNGSTIKFDGKNAQYFDKTSGRKTYEGPIEGIWAKIPDVDKEKFMALGIDPTKYVIAGNNKPIIGNEFSESSLNPSSLAAPDQKLIGKTTTFQIKGSGNNKYIETNSPGVLADMGFELKHESGKGYYIVNSKGERIDETKKGAKDGIFYTTGGAKELTGESSKERLFQIRISDRVPAQTAPADSSAVTPPAPVPGVGNPPTPAPAPVPGVGNPPTPAPAPVSGIDSTLTVPGTTIRTAPTKVNSIQAAPPTDSATTAITPPVPAMDSATIEKEYPMYKPGEPVPGQTRLGIEGDLRELDPKLVDKWTDYDGNPINPDGTLKMDEPKEAPKAAPEKPADKPAETKVDRNVGKDINTEDESFYGSADKPAEKKAEGEYKPPFAPTITGTKGGKTGPSKITPTLDTDADGNPVIKTIYGKTIKFKSNDPEVDPKYMSEDSIDLIKGLPFDGQISGIKHHKSRHAVDMSIEEKWKEYFYSEAGAEYLAKKGYEAHEEYASKRRYRARLKELGLEDNGNSARANPSYLITYNTDATADHIHFQKAKAKKEKNE